MLYNVAYRSLQGDRIYHLQRLTLTVARRICADLRAEGWDARVIPAN